MKEYLRDKRSPAPLNETTSRVMSANKAKNTSPELVVRKKLCEDGMRGYRLHMKNLPGRPDIAYTKKKIAIFINGCFWHRCPYCNYSLPKHNTEFWNTKFSANIIRDTQKIDLLHQAGWKVVILWECQIMDNLNNCIEQIRSMLSNKSGNDIF